MGSRVNLPSGLIEAGSPGGGGTGHTRRVESARRLGPLALRDFSPAAGSSPGALRAELKRIRNLRHPNLARIEILPVEEGDACVRTLREWVAGSDPASTLQAGRPELLLDTAAETLCALRMIHEFDLVHAAVQPSNLLLRSTPLLGRRVVLLDGLVRGCAGAAADDPTRLPYRAPECLGGSEATPRSDLYSLGVVLFEALHGRTPVTLKGGDVAAFIDAVRTGRRARPRAPAGFPTGLSPWIDELLDPDPSRRPDGATDALERLNSACGVAYEALTADGRAARLASTVENRSASVGPDELREILERSTGTSPSPTKLRRLQESSDGDRLTAELLAVEGVAERGRFCRGPVARDRAIGARLARLPDRARRMVHLLAIAGEALDEIAAAAAARMQPLEARDALSELWATGLARPTAAGWEIHPAPLSDCLRDRLDDAPRAELARTLAERLGADPGVSQTSPYRLAQLWSMAGSPRRAVDHAVRAAELARSNSDPRVAAERYGFALRHLPRRDTSRAELRRMQAESFAAAGLDLEAARALATVARRTEDPQRRAAVLTNQAVRLVHADRPGAARRVAERALDLARGGDWPRLRQAASRALGEALHHAGRVGEALPVLQAALAGGDDRADPATRARSLHALARSEAAGGVSGARDRFAVAIEQLDSAGSAADRAQCRIDLAKVELRAADHAAAERLLLEARQIASEEGCTRSRVRAQLGLANNALLHGYYAAAVGLTREIEEEFGLTERDATVVRSRSCRARALTRCGKAPQALALLEPLIAGAPGIADRSAAADARLALVEIRLSGRQVDPAAIGSELDRLRSDRCRGGDPDTELGSLVLEMEWRARQEDRGPVDEVRSELDSWVARGSAWHQPWFVIQADLAQAAAWLRRGDTVGAVRIAERAADLARRHRLPGAGASAQALLCSALERGDRLDDALEAHERGRQRLQEAADRIDDASLRRGFVEGRAFGTLRRPPGLAVAPSMDRRLLALYDMIRGINSERDPNALLEWILAMALEVVQAERGMILLREPGTDEFTIRLARNLEEETVADAENFSRSIVAQAGAGKSVLALDASRDERFRDLKSVSLYDIHSLMCVPLRSRGAITGTVYLDSRRAGGLFTADDLRFLEAFADHAALALENARARARLESENQRLQAVAEARVQFGNLVGESPAMLEVFDLIDKFAASDLPVLILGESGTGKELVARAIHFNGERRKQAFVSENCAAIPDSLLQSELFGHVRGAFTGAERDRAGLFEQADGGTLFLDEVGDMSGAMQAQLLRTLQEGEVRRVGDERAIRVDVRVIAATHRDFQREVAEGRFREDLMYRLQVLEIHLPPLRDRPGDVALLTRHFLRRIAEERGRPVSVVEPEVLELMERHRWPGNVRQLENLLQRLSLLAGDGAITTAVLRMDPNLSGTLKATEALPRASLSLDQSEREQVERALRASRGNRARASRMLGISRATIYRKIKEYDL